MFGQILGVVIGLLMGAAWWKRSVDAAYAVVAFCSIGTLIELVQGEWFWVAVGIVGVIVWSLTAANLSEQREPTP